MNHISDYWPESIIMCELCHHDIKDLGNMVQVTITRNPLEDNNIIEKHHVYCQTCWNRMKIIIDERCEDCKHADDNPAFDSCRTCGHCYISHFEKVEDDPLRNQKLRINYTPNKEA